MTRNDYGAWGPTHSEKKQCYNNAKKGPQYGLNGIIDKVADLESCAQFGFQFKTVRFILPLSQKDFKH
jgi:hypothetical protein